ncbi:MAG: 16S rRNA (guanine(527)-N(7))-methyltransferase RsmG [Armatimonadota bacterium]|nr:16S rRNA (guanine(527)-N(7))-methyltransferase RsmG [bacterium]
MSYISIAELSAGALELGIELSEEQLGLFDRFAEFLVQTNMKFNLTRITDPGGIVASHFLDSLTCLRAVDFKNGDRVIDVGAGPGFPGLPMKIARPDLHVTLLDSTFKKVKFISDAAEMLELEGIEAMQGRAEDVGRNKDFRERFDVACARALSELRVLAELCLPLVRVGGYVIAQKSGEIDDELASARPVIGQLGGCVRDVVRMRIPGTEIDRQLVVISKTKPTPDTFPRPYSRIAKSKS